MSWALYDVAKARKEAALCTISEGPDNPLAEAGRRERLPHKLVILARAEAELNLATTCGAAGGRGGSRACKVHARREDGAVQDCVEEPDRARAGIPENTVLISLWSWSLLR